MNEFEQMLKLAKEVSAQVIGDDLAEMKIDEFREMIAAVDAVITAVEERHGRNYSRLNVIGQALAAGYMWGAAGDKTNIGASRILNA